MARLRHAEAEAERHAASAAAHREAHIELDQRVQRLEAELAVLRHERLETCMLWFNARDDRDRNQHIARRMRRKLDRLRRRAPLADPG
ncbi:hypothetical protein ACFOVU_05515 [Nocardiopsis sediminis]|uniref:Uncharacterized protein n=1 Tax=Nocardiopsis sediminis TaxID=1778267 RepID=A0ABV8FJ17_9ACTN